VSRDAENPSHCTSEAPRISSLFLHCIFAFLGTSSHVCLSRMLKIKICSPWRSFGIYPYCRKPELCGIIDRHRCADICFLLVVASWIRICVSISIQAPLKYSRKCVRGSPSLETSQRSLLEGQTAPNEEGFTRPDSFA